MLKHYIPKFNDPNAMCKPVAAFSIISRGGDNSYNLDLQGSP